MKLYEVKIVRSVTTVFVAESEDHVREILADSEKLGDFHPFDDWDDDHEEVTEIRRLSTSGALPPKFDEGCYPFYDSTIQPAEELTIKRWRERLGQ